jgi:hypothetical protein
MAEPISPIAYLLEKSELDHKIRIILDSLIRIQTLLEGQFIDYKKAALLFDPAISSKKLRRLIKENHVNVHYVGRTPYLLRRDVLSILESNKN